MDPIQLLKDDIRKYKDLKDQSARIDMELDVIKTNVFNALKEVNSKELECPGVGSFRVESKRTWIYPANVLNEIDKLDHLKDDAMALGTATYTEKEYVKFYEEKQK